eukprot:695505-Prorocentrum_minimum.AAC.1
MRIYPRVVLSSQVRLSDSVCECVVPGGGAGAKAVSVAVGGKSHRVESRKEFLFAYVMSPQVQRLH